MDVTTGREQIGIDDLGPQVADRAEERQDAAVSPEDRITETPVRR